MRRGAWLLWCGLALWAPPAAAQEDGGEKKLTPEQELAWLLKDGPIHLKTRSYHAAARAYARAVELAPENFDARYGLATAYTKLDNLRAAIEHAKKAAALRPGHTGVQVILGEAQFKLKRFKEARATLEALYKKAPETPGLTAMLGRLNMGEGKLEAALPFLEDAALDSRDGEVHFQYGECLFRLGQYNHAMGAFNSAKSYLRPGKPPGLKERAETRFAQARARIRTFGTLEEGGLVFVDANRKVRVQRPAGWEWAFVFGEGKRPRERVCVLATQDDLVTVTLDVFGEKARVQVGRQSVPAGELGNLRTAHETDFALTHKKVKPYRPVPVRTTCDKKLSTALRGVLRKGSKGDERVRQVTLLVTQDQVWRVTIDATKKRMKDATRELAALFKGITLPK